MTEQEIIAKGVAENPPPPAPEADMQTGPNGQPTFPEHWPDPAKKRINQLHGQKIGLHAKLDAERQMRLAAEQKLRDEQTKRKKLEAELPTYQTAMLDQASARYELENQRAGEQLSNVFRMGDLTPEKLQTSIGNIVASKLSQIELQRAKKEIVSAPPPQDTPAPPTNNAPQDLFDQLEAQGKTAVTKAQYNAQAQRFMQKHGFNLQSADDTPAGLKKNAALQLDQSAVQNNHLVGSHDYWEFIEDGIERAVPRNGSEEHSETGAAQPLPRAVPSVAAPAARTNTTNGTGRKKPELNEVDRGFLARNPGLKEEDILREKEDY